MMTRLSNSTKSSINLIQSGHPTSSNVVDRYIIIFTRQARHYRVATRQHLQSIQSEPRAGHNNPLLDSHALFPTTSASSDSIHRKLSLYSRCSQALASTSQLQRYTPTLCNFATSLSRPRRQQRRYASSFSPQQNSPNANSNLFPSESIAGTYQDAKPASGATGSFGTINATSEDVKSRLGFDELNTLLRHPALHDPILIPRFPIVLLHGLYGFDVRGPAFFRLHYWGDVLRIMRNKMGVEVFVTAVPGTGAIKQRAQVLHQSLEATEALRGRELNLIGHSMGGLDARYLLSNIHPKNYHPRSLTTISTPHRGSEFMSWCRANIGIGTDFAEPLSAYEPAPDLTLPFSLKNPILSRAQVEAAKRLSDANKAAKDRVVAERVRQGNFPGLPYSLGTSLTAYLLDLLDSPAYANLTPSFLQDVFNPATPDRDDIKYYSIAARTRKISILHPLWLPKQVLDGAEAARMAARGGVLGEGESGSRGNDGLVTIESAKWGHFLGTLENCDHWEVRGSSGLMDTAVKEMTSTTSTPAPTKENGKSWKWQDVYALVAKFTSKSPSPASPTSPAAATPALAVIVAPSAPSLTQHTAPAASINPRADAQNDETTKIASLATWIVERLPSSPPHSAVSIPSVIKNLSSGTVGVNVKKEKEIGRGETESERAQRFSQDARMLYGSSTTTSSTTTPPKNEDVLPTGSTTLPPPVISQNSKSNGKEEKFNLERVCLAICRKLHNDGF